MDEDTPLPAPAKPSQVPSWVTLGFVLGALFVLALPRRAAVEPGPRPVMEPTPAKLARPPEAPRITTIEAVFVAWDKYAVWSDGKTEVALWNPDTKSFSDCYEVIREDDAYFFRSIPSLTRLVLNHGVVTECPLQFTETVRQRQEWLREVDRENLKALSGATRDLLTTPAEKKPGDGK